MTTILLATASVHVTAAGVDYLAGRLEESDTILGVAVVATDTDERDAGDALNVLMARVVGPTVETIRREGDPATEILTVAEDRAVDEITIGARRGDPAVEFHGLGGTAASVLADADRPVVVLPVGQYT